MKLHVYREIFEKIFKYQISRKSVQWEPICSMRMDRHEEDKSLFTFLRKRIKNLKKIYIKTSHRNSCKGIAGVNMQPFSFIFIVPALCGLFDMPLRLIAHTHSGYEYALIAGLTSPPSSHNFRNLLLVTGSLYLVGVNYGHTRHGRQMS